MPKYGAMSLLLEFVIKEIPIKSATFTLAKGFITYEIPRHQIKTQYVQRLIFERQVTREPIKEVLPAVILNAMTLLSLYQMEEHARDEMGRGNVNSATHQMENLATRLIQKGEVNLAQSILDEVAYIQQNQSFSEGGEKRLKYGTRSLLLPARTVER
jgi:Ca-activated chloride channel family protein